MKNCQMYLLWNLKEKFVKEKEAERFLENLAEEKQISADAKLANKIQEGKGCLVPRA